MANRRRLVVAVVGRGQSGKTCLTQVMYGGHFRPDPDTTFGVVGHFMDVEVSHNTEAQDIAINLIDTSSNPLDFSTIAKQLQ